MSTILSVNGNCVTKFISNTVSLFTNGCEKSNDLDSMARETNALKRERESFNFRKFVCTALKLLGGKGLHQQSFHLENFREKYMIDNDKEISNKGFNKRLANEDNIEFFTECANQLMRQYNAKSMKNLDKTASKELKEILDKLGVKDIYAVDGCEITLRESARGKFPNKGVGRNKLDGRPAAPAIKLHVLYSYVNRTFTKIDITEAVEDERQHVIEECLKGNILIADRGYISEELEARLIGLGVKIIIKGKVNMVSGTIVEAYGENHTKLDDYIGKQYGEIKLQDDKYLDVTVQTKSGHNIRIVRMLNPNCESTRKNPDAVHQQQEKAEGKYIYLRTNITREKLSVEKLFMLYRLRWALEFFFACLQQGNCLKSINSSNKTIILTFILLSLMSALLKSYLALCAILKKGKETTLASLSMLKIHYKFFLFDEVFSKFGKVQKTQLYEYLNKLYDDIIKGSSIN